MRHIIKRKNLEKRSKQFVRPQSDCKAGSIKPCWRRPKGIDGPVRRKFKGKPPMPNIGYRTNKNLRDVMPNAFRKIIVNNTFDLDMLVMQNRNFAAEISHGVSSRNRKNIVERAALLNIHILNKTM